MHKIVTFLKSIIFCFQALAQDQIMVCDGKDKTTWKLTEGKLFVRSLGKWVEWCKPNNKSYRYKNNSDGTQYYKLHVYKNSAVCLIKRHGFESKDNDRIGVSIGLTAVIDFLLLYTSYQYEKDFFEKDNPKKIRNECTKFDANK